MGGIGSKEETARKDLNLVNFLDVIATKYILTQNFQDLKNLTKKEYCNKLVILTAKTIKKFFKEKDILYLAQRIDDGIPYNRIKNENLIYLDTNSLIPSSDRFSKEERERFQQDREKDIQKQLYKKYKKDYDYNYNGGGAKGNDGVKGGGLRSYITGLLDDADDERYRDRKYRRRSPRSQYRVKPMSKKTLLSELDVRNPMQKDRMCKGIAKFYVKIAHLFAAIAKTINPRYVFKDRDNNIKDYSIWNKKKIPKNAVPRFVEDSLCSRRLKALAPTQSDGTVTINFKNVCRLNRKIRTLTAENYPDYFSEHGKRKTFVRSLGEEEGIPALEDLYNDKYDYLKGKFISRIPGGKGAQQYQMDLKEFYEAFTASPNNTNKLSYSQWNASGNKKFADVPLADYHNSDLCNSRDAKWRKSYRGSGGLFTEYANHVTAMMRNAQKNQNELLSILKKVFVFMEAENVEKTKILTLNPKLTYDELEVLVNKTRKQIVKLYVDCQNDFQRGLNIFEGIIMERHIKNAVNRNKSLQEEGDRVIAAEPSKQLTTDIQDAMVDMVVE